MNGRVARWSFHNCLALLFVCIAVFASSSSGATDSVHDRRANDTRLALIIGNGAYRTTRPLNNASNDARLMAKALKQLGFTIVGGARGEPLIDADRKTMRAAIQSFGEQLARYTPAAIGLFYYAGHAVQVNGKNFLIPIDAEIRREVDLEDEAISADAVLRQMVYSRQGLNLLILDACRDNPYRSLSRSMGGEGLASILGPYGSLIEYSTGPNEVAADGEESNSLYTSALAEVMLVPGLQVEAVFKRVRAIVIDKTGLRQVPWEASSFVGEFYFSGDPRLKNAQLPTPPPPLSAEQLQAYNASILRQRSVFTGFPVDQYQLSPATYRMLDDFARTIKNDLPASLKFEINGHTAIAGKLGYNIALSMSRAESVRNYLISRGVSANRLKAQGFGPLELLDKVDVNSALNNRLEIVALRL